MTRRRWEGVQVADARQLGSLLPRRECLDATITSPPYGSLVDYGVPNQIGFGQSYESYLRDMSSVFGVLWSRTKSTGSLWLIVDTFKDRVAPGLSKVVPLPFQLASRAAECGWILQDVIIWEKDHTIPWSRRGQFRNSFEYVLFFAKGPDFKYHIERIKEVHAIKGWWVSYPERYSPAGVTPSNIWRFPVPKQGSWAPDVFEHHCPLPPSMVARIVELSTDPGDVVCDPFAGVGTVPAVAASLNRRYVGTELVSAYVAQFYSFLLPRAMKERRACRSSLSASRQDEYHSVIALLRHIKFPRVLVRRLTGAGVPIVGAIVRTQVRNSAEEPSLPVGAQKIHIYVPDDVDHHLVLEQIQLALTRPPLSKFGITAEVRVRSASEWRRPRGSQRWSRLRLSGATPPELLNGQTLSTSIDDPPILVDIDASELAETISAARELVGASP